MNTPTARETRACQIQINDNVTLEGDLSLPPKPRGLILFAHGSGSSRHSPRNQFVAGALQQAGFATLLMDLLNAEEEAQDLENAQLRFNIPFLSERVVSATNWLSAQPATDQLKIGYFGASTGAAAALMASTLHPLLIGAIVSRGGRPDLASSALTQVKAPTLLLVGSADTAVIELNRMAYSLLQCEKELILIPGATHLFEEPGTLEQVAQLASQWFTKYLA
ncbi:alpha/beta hydrolase [Ktedonosporobacter rubrisoli]|uniref:Alpha/beta hydrolase n=1 Tax=Ktedonosporobacter rubrisoli TaxID=2509675 RepID=A0A4P6JTM1_KTERU|nr:dienelactone hydrolase family protein [Ktedonosporobacter rubrisoli]QBD78675.1 alpha/beta hydrolase [Ktedonosporobacter rubrisoli]